ncbi:transposase (plasmid) [Hymenobacter sp. NBH84]|nr:transposase [Hymenobacter sp. NBH84]
MASYWFAAARTTPTAPVFASGLQRGALPATFPAWTTVYYYFYQWQRTGR